MSLLKSDSWTFKMLLSLILYCLVYILPLKHIRFYFFSASMIAAGIDAFVVTLLVGVWAKIDLYAFLKIKHFFVCVCANTYKT